MICVNQNNVVSALRGTEILSDPTNMLTLILAGRLQRKEADNQHPLHVCATARALRAQVFPAAPGFYSHFGLFCMVSSCRDTGGYASEKEMLSKHLLYYRKLFLEKYDANLSVTLQKRGSYTDGDGLLAQVAACIAEALPGVPLSVDPTQSDSHYYMGINFKLYMQKGDTAIEIGDGGFVDWIRQMTGSKKERCLISGIGLDRLLLL